jgi:hypothetical protein
MFIESIPGLFKVRNFYPQPEGVRKGTCSCDEVIVCGEANNNAPAYWVVKSELDLNGSY